jgi:hypothetical protein
VESIIHVSVQDAYERMLHELSIMNAHFYDDFDVRKLRRQQTKDGWKKFDIPGKLFFSNKNETHLIFHCQEILKMLDVIYRMRNCCLTIDGELINNDFSGI